MYEMGQFIPERLTETLSTESRVKKAPRTVGYTAGKLGCGTEVLLGLLDGGMPLSDVIEGLVMHGDLPSLDERPADSENELHLVADDSGTWRLANPVSDQES